MRNFRRGLVLAAFSGIAVLGVACTDSGSSDAIEVTLDDFSISPSTTTAETGEITFSATNEGSETHEFEIFTVPEGVDPSALEVSDDAADTGAAGMTVVDEVEDIAPSTTAELTVNLEAGAYALICNLPGHYAEGMVTEFTVT